MGKGSTPRPFDVDEETFAGNWAKIFGNKDAKPEEKKEVAQLNVDLARYNAVPQPRAFTITAPTAVVKPVNGKTRAEKIKYAKDLPIYEKYIRDLKTFNDRLAIFTQADLEYKDAQTQIVRINADIANIVTKYTALIPKLIADIKADVVKYTGEYNALDTGWICCLRPSAA